MILHLFNHEKILYNLDLEHCFPFSSCIYQTLHLAIYYFILASITHNISCHHPLTQKPRKRKEKKKLERKQNRESELLWIFWSFEVGGFARASMVRLSIYKNKPPAPKKNYKEKTKKVLKWKITESKSGTVSFLGSFEEGKLARAGIMHLNE